VRLAVLFVGVCAAIASVACQRPHQREVIGVHRDHPEEEPPKPKTTARVVPRDVVMQGELPFHGFRDKDATQLSPVDFFDELADADVICVGEDHANPHAHWAELKVLHSLVERTAMNGKELALGLEMVDRGKQSVLDRFGRYELDEDEFLKESEWSERWGYDFSYYRPQIELMQHKELGILALNLPKEISKKLARGGVASLLPGERAQLPRDIDLTDDEHRAWFDSVMKSHPPAGDPDKVYLAQVAWDEAMAENAARWLKRRIPGRQLVIFAGSGHCRADAIPNRIGRRLQANVRSVRPLVLGENDEPGTELDGYDYALVMQKE
jgi:uncharacterized iron-regulated protein